MSDTDIVERLRIKDATGVSLSMLMEEAADEIERLRAQVIEAEKYNGWHQQAMLEIERLCRDKDQLIAIAADEMRQRDAEIERLRAALGEKP